MPRKTATRSRASVSPRRARPHCAAGPALPTREQVAAVLTQRNTKIRHTEMAQRLGVDTRLIRRAFIRGALPGAIEHSHNIIMVPLHLLRLAEAYGLRQVERMAQAGLLTAN